MDCSGFVVAVFSRLGIEGLPRTTRDQFRDSRPVSRVQARPGDLVFFRSSGMGRINHVGIFMGEQTFAHSSTSRGVVYSRLDETYYRRRLVGFRRMVHRAAR